MPKRPCRLVLAWLLLLAGMVACSRTPDDAAIRAAIDAAVAGAEARRPADVLAVVADDFIGNDGVDRDGLHDLLRAHMVVAGALGVHIPGRIDVELQGDRAVARFGAVMTDSSGRWIPDRIRTLQFETGWRREGGAWRCYYARWSGSAD